LLEVLHGQTGDDAARSRWQRREHRGSTGDLREVHKSHGVNGIEMIAHAGPIPHGPARVAGPELLDAGADAARVPRHAPNAEAAQPPAPGKPGQPLPPQRQCSAWSVERFGHVDPEKDGGGLATAPDHDSEMDARYGTSASVVVYFALIAGMSTLAISRCTAAPGWTPSSDMPVPNGAVADP